ncbi:MAG: hypothetical protein ABIZ56_05845 [Chthoniobacteraceae bacterium]
MLPLVILPALSVSSCKKATPKTSAKLAAQASVKRNGPAEDDFRDARGYIFEGNFAEAAEGMRRLNARNDVPEKYQDWVLIFGGMAELLVDREKESRPLFAQLAERHAASRTVGKLSPFFYDLGIVMNIDGTVPGRGATRYDKTNHEAIALLLFGLKNESLGALDDAVTFYRQFSTAVAMGPELWIGFNPELKKLRQMATDLCEYEELVDSATKSKASAASEETIEKAVREAKDVRARIKWQGKLMAALDPQLVEKKAVMAAQDDADAEAFPLAKAKWSELCAKYEFGEARRAIFEAKLKTTKRMKEQELMASQAAYLDQFKFFLLLEARDEGFAKPVKLKSGETVEGGIAKMDDSFMYLRTKSGEKQVPWSAVSAESIYAFAQSLVTADEDAAKACVRKWNLGNFAAFIGRTDEARTLLTAAAKMNNQYEPEVEGLLALSAKP